MILRYKKLKLRVATDKRKFEMTGFLVSDWTFGFCSLEVSSRGGETSECVLFASYGCNGAE